MKIKMNIPVDMTIEPGTAIHRKGEVKTVKAVKETGKTRKRSLSGPGFSFRYIYEKEVIVEV